MPKKDYKKEQQKFRELSKPKFHPKGAKVTIMGWDEKKKKYVEKELPNADGAHYMGIGGKLVRVNRRRVRQRYVDRTPTKKGKFVVETTDKTDKRGVKIKARTLRHKVNPHTYELPYAPSLSNHKRMKLREEERNARQESVPTPSGT